jgi:hypothetical protein
VPNSGRSSQLRPSAFIERGTVKVLAEGFPGVGLESSFAGDAVNVQFIVKDSKKYAASGGWGFADFTNGKPGDDALHEKCWPCHQPGKDRDYVFTRYAPAAGPGGHIKNTIGRLD